MSGDSKPTSFGASPYPDEVPAGALAFTQTGTVLVEKYRVERVLGVGGMGVVLSVLHLKLGERYAMKCLLPRGASDPEAVERFLREAKAAAAIRSEHVVRVTDAGQLENGGPYMLMEHLEGTDLAKLLVHTPQLPIATAIEYVLQACTGIAEAHALGIVHRDLKPANMFLTQRRDGPDLVKILDFGISKAMDDSLHAPQLTQTSSVFGSPAYMSPEQIRSAKNVDYRTDVWALGVILYELITGHLPFVAETSGGLLSAIAADEPTSMDVYRTDVPDALELVIRRCLEKNVALRYQNVSALATALEPFCGPTSLASVGRIRRLSSAPEPLPRPPSLPAPAGRPRPATVTESAWVTGPRTRSLRTRVVRTGIAIFAFVIFGATVIQWALRSH